jgi:hypothetical protein
MTVPAGKVPIIQCISQAVAAWRSGFRATVPAAALLGLAGAVLSLILGPQAIATNPAALLSLGAALLGPTALYYAHIMRGASGAGYGFSRDSLRDGVAVFAGVGVVGFFLLLAMIATNVAANAILFAPFMEELQDASEDPAVMQAMAERVMAENPTGVLVAFLLFAIVIMLLTSRLYLAGPASVAAHRGRSFETWIWTKGNMLRIIGARLLLLVPAYALATLIGLVAAAPTVALLSGGADAPSALGIAVGLGFIGFVQALIYQALEAHLAVVLYKGLRPPTA